MYSIPCILFAGGKSSRMGEDKSLLPFGGYSTLTEYQFARLSELFSTVYISTKDANKFDFLAPFITDPENVDFAPTAGFVSTFRTVTTESIMVLSVDTPFVTQSHFDKLLEANDRTFDAIIARTPTGIHPMCGIYHRTLADKMEYMLREHDHRLGKLLSTSHTRYVDFQDETPFMNLNHPHEYQAALSFQNTQ